MKKSEKEIGAHNKFIQPDCARPTRLLRSKSRAGDASGFGFPAETLRPCSLVNKALYGRKN